MEFTWSIAITCKSNSVPSFLFSVHEIEQEHVCGHVILQGDFQRVEGFGNLPRHPAERDPVFFRDLPVGHKPEPAVGKDLTPEFRHLAEFAPDDFFHVVRKEVGFNLVILQ